MPPFIFEDRGALYPSISPLSLLGDLAGNFLYDGLPSVLAGEKSALWRDIGHGEFLGGLL